MWFVNKPRDLPDYVGQPRALDALDDHPSRQHETDRPLLELPPHRLRKLRGRPVTVYEVLEVVGQQRAHAGLQRARQQRVEKVFFVALVCRLTAGWVLSVRRSAVKLHRTADGKMRRGGTWSASVKT